MTWLRDLWRGYRDADLSSAQSKLRENTKPGGVTYLTARERRALSANRLTRMRAELEILRAHPINVFCPQCGHVIVLDAEAPASR